MTIKANGFTSTSDDLIPDGTIVDVTDTPMDFRKPRCVGDDIDSDYPPIVLQVVMTTTMFWISRKELLQK